MLFYLILILLGVALLITIPPVGVIFLVVLILVHKLKK